MRPYVLYAAMMLAVAAFSAGAVAGAMFPRLDAAENDLRSALRNMNAAATIYHGHKHNAENLVRQALQELQIGKASVR